MSCDFNDCLNCKREKCILDDKTTSFFEKEKRKRYNRDYYQKKRAVLKERAKQRAKELRRNKTCKCCGKPLDLKEGAFYYRRKYFCSLGCIKNYLFMQVEKDVRTKVYD